MDCRILRSLTLKSDGHVCCDDSSGYDVHLGEVSSKRAWSIRDLTHGSIWNHIRQSFHAGRVPWPGTCEGCDLLSPGASPLDTLDFSMEIRVEPTLACELRCPCCTRQREARKRMGSWFLDPAIFESLLRSCVKQGIEVSRIVYLGLGEPLEHPDFERLCDIAKSIVPDAIQELGTNGNHLFTNTVRSACLDRIIIAGDGARESSYVKYRIRGNFAATLQFMHDAKKYAVNNPFVEWKYILFEFNDSDEEIREAQQMAEGIGVDSIMFIVTPSKWRSKRFRSDNLHTFPCISPLATVSPAAGLQKVQFAGNLIADAAVIGRKENATCFVDSCVLLTCGVLRIEGWALGADGAYVERVELIIDDRLICAGRTVHERRDVPRVVQNAAGPACGFIFQYPYAREWFRSSEGGDELDMEVRVHTKGAVASFRCTYTFPGCDVDSVITASAHVRPSETERMPEFVILGDE